MAVVVVFEALYHQHPNTKIKSYQTKKRERPSHKRHIKDEQALLWGIRQTYPFLNSSISFFCTPSS